MLQAENDGVLMFQNENGRMFFRLLFSRKIVIMNLYF